MKKGMFYSSRYNPDVYNPNQVWVFMDDEYDGRFSNATSGAVLLPSVATVVQSQDMNNPAVFRACYGDDLRRPSARQFIISIIAGVILNDKEVIFCPGTSPTELFLNDFLGYLQWTYGITVGGETGVQFSINQSFYDVIANEAMAFGIKVTPYDIHNSLYGHTTPISPFKKGGIRNDSVFKEELPF